MIGGGMRGVESIVRAQDGTELMLDSWAHEYTYSDGKIVTDTVTDFQTGIQYRKTFTWDNGTLVSETCWVRL